jgi:hypothetical protein
MRPVVAAIDRKTRLRRIVGARVPAATLLDSDDLCARRAVFDSGNSGNPRVDERYLTVGIPGWAQSSRGAALHLDIEG